jgi:hypothetical protein
MNTIKGVKVILALVCVLFGAFLIYGFVTDCPNTAGYFFCSESERRFLQQ